MGDQHNNLWDEWDEWVTFAAQDAPFGEPERNAGDCGSTRGPKSAWGFIPETESKCRSMNIDGEICVACRPLEAHADGNNNV